MKQREVRTADGIAWTCVQAFSGIDGSTAEAAEQKLDNEPGPVAVVCTPSGGSGTRRLELPTEWMEKLSDDELVARIDAAG